MEPVDSTIPSVPRKAGHISVSDSAESRPSDEGDFAATLLAMAGHDLRRPLQVIANAHHALAAMLRGKAEREELAHAAEGVEQLACMLSQLLEVLQLRERPREQLNVPILLGPVVADLRREFREPAHRKGITLRVASASSTICSERVLLTGILRNLVRNAIAYTPPGGLVTVTTSQRGSELRIEVSDTGTGIDASMLPRLFNAFQRGDQSHAGGLGLGLFIVKRAADLLGHRIEVHSVEGAGSRFTLVTRAVASHASEPGRPSAGCRCRGLAKRDRASYDLYAACA
jgi:two-component system, OmpR family, phosphate regulon sensor histidine kinase PhoR